MSVAGAGTISWLVAGEADEGVRAAALAASVAGVPMMEIGRPMSMTSVDIPDSRVTFRGLSTTGGGTLPAGGEAETLSVRSAPFARGDGVVSFSLSFLEFRSRAEEDDALFLLPRLVRLPNPRKLFLLFLFSSFSLDPPLGDLRVPNSEAVAGAGGCRVVVRTGDGVGAGGVGLGLSGTRETISHVGEVEEAVLEVEGVVMADPSS